MDAFVPLTFAPAEAYQFDWSEEWIVLDGVTTRAQAAHVRLCHSPMPFVVVYAPETREMVFDAHARAAAFYGDLCQRGIHDGPKVAGFSTPIDRFGLDMNARLALLRSKRRPVHDCRSTPQRGGIR